MASFLFHGVLATIFFNGQIGWQAGTQTDDTLLTKPATISVRLYSQNPQIQQVPEPVLANGESFFPEPAEMEDTLSAELLVEESSVVSEFENLEEPSQ